MVEISQQTTADEAAIDALMVEAFGAGRHARSVWLLRTVPAVADLCLVMHDAGTMLASLRFWEVRLNEQIVLLLGPLAVQPDLRGQGYGRQIVAAGLARAKALGKWPLVLVSGEPDYYPKFGFVPAAPYQLQWPGFVEPERLQFLELQDGALAGLMPPLKVQGMTAAV
jgi:predicted N-acetyltransferase YhbS